MGCAQLGCRGLDCAKDPLVARASADLTAEHVPDFFFAGAGVGIEEFVDGHEEARCAETALKAVFFCKSFLDGV